MPTVQRSTGKKIHAEFLTTLIGFFLPFFLHGAAEKISNFPVLYLTFAACSSPENLSLPNYLDDTSERPGQRRH